MIVWKSMIMFVVYVRTCMYSCCIQYSGRTGYTTNECAQVQIKNISATINSNETRHLPAPLITLCPALFVTDIDECTDGTNDCADANSVCANMPGSFTCTCDPGYSGDGTACIGE